VVIFVTNLFQLIEIDRAGDIKHRTGQTSHEVNCDDDVHEPDVQSITRRPLRVTQSVHLFKPLSPSSEVGKENAYQDQVDQEEHQVGERQGKKC